MQVGAAFPPLYLSWYLQEELCLCQYLMEEQCILQECIDENLSKWIKRGTRQDFVLTNREVLPGNASLKGGLGCSACLLLGRL